MSHPAIEAKAKFDKLNREVHAAFAECLVASGRELVHRSIPNLMRLLAERRAALDVAIDQVQRAVPVLRWRVDSKGRPEMFEIDMEGESR